MDGPSVLLSADALAVVVTSMEELGLDTKPLLRSAGLRDPRGGPQGQQVPYDRVSSFWEAAALAVDDDALGIRVAEALDPEPLSLLLHLGRTASSFRQAMDKVRSYASLLGEGIFFHLTECEGSQVLVHSLAEAEPHPSAADYALAAFVVFVRRELGPGFSPSMVNLRRPRPRSAAAYQAFFRAPLFFDAEHNALGLCGLPTTPPRGADPSLHHLLEQFAIRVLDERGGNPGFESELRGLIAAEMTHGRPSAALISSRLGMSPRTLRRRLAGHGINFLEILDEVRLEFAERLLESHSVADVSDQLGFADPSAFHRAYRRWTGKAPRRSIRRRDTH